MTALKGLGESGWPRGPSARHGRSPWALAARPMRAHARLSIRREVCAGGGSVGSETLDRGVALTLDPQRPATGPDEQGCMSGMTPHPRLSHESDASAVCGGTLKLFVMSVCCLILLLPLVSTLEKDA